MHSEPSFAIFNGYKQIKKSIYSIYEINRNPLLCTVDINVKLFTLSVMKSLITVN